MYSRGHRRLTPLGRGLRELSSDGSLTRPERVWLDRGSDQASRSELAAGCEDHATTIPINRTWTNIRRGFGRAGTCPEPRCITIAPAGCREAATSTSAAAAARRYYCQARHLYARLPLAGEWSLQGRERFGFFDTCRAASWHTSRRYARLSDYGRCRVPQGNTRVQGPMLGQSLLRLSFRALPAC